MTAPSTEQPPPGQEQEYPGRAAEMDPRPRDEMRGYVAFAKEGADVAIAYLSEVEDEDAARTAELIEAAGRRRVTIVFFASGRLSSYYSGEVLAPVGGETLPG
jgi:hypothetical protein